MLSNFLRDLNAMFSIKLKSHTNDCFQEKCRYLFTIKVLIYASATGMIPAKRKRSKAIPMINENRIFKRGILDGVYDFNITFLLDKYMK